MAGFRETPEHDAVFALFDRGNEWTFRQLHRRFAQGPIDWDAVYGGTNDSGAAVVRVVEDARYRSLREDTSPSIYMAASQVAGAPLESDRNAARRVPAPLPTRPASPRAMTGP